MRTLHYSKTICAHVTTYQNLSNYGEPMIRMLKKILNTFKPYLDSIDIVIQIEKTNDRYLQYKLNDKNLNKLYDLILKGEVQYLSIQESIPDISPSFEVDEIVEYPPLFALGVSFNHASTYPPDFSEHMAFHDGFGFSLNERLFDNIIPTEVQNQYVELFLELIHCTNAVTGYITYETTSVIGQMMTNFEAVHQIHYSLQPGYRKRLRGYFWLNYLTNGHIEALGGLDNVIKNNPCYSATVVESNNQKGVLLQLTEDINHYSNDELSRLKQYLLPLLLKSGEEKLENNFSFDEGYIVRLVD